MESKIYENLKTLKDPEFDVSLEELEVIKPHYISEYSENNFVIFYKPTVPHCHMANLIGICIIYKLRKCFKDEFQLLVRILDNTHMQYAEINKQLSDYERVFAALENKNLIERLEGLCP